MEMEFKEGGGRRRILLIVGSLLAVLAAVGVFLLTSSAQPTVAEVPMKTVLVARVEIPARTVIDEGMILERTMPDDPSLDRAMTDPTAVVGRATGVNIYAQQPITNNLFATSAVGSAFAVMDPDEVIGPDTPHWRAVSIDVPPERAVGGSVVAGQRVDVVVTTDVVVEPKVDPVTGAVTPMVAYVAVRDGDPQPEGTIGECRQSDYFRATAGDPLDSDPTIRYCAVSQTFKSEKASKVAFQDIEVLAVTETRYVLRVDEKVAEEISHLQATGASIFSFVLRGDGDTRHVDTTDYGETTNRFIEEYGLPVPEVYPRP
jgi:Flp pilus assembly protein CpaB